MMHGAGKALVPEMGGRWGGNEALTIAMVTRTCLLVIPFGHSIAAEDARPSFTGRYGRPVVERSQGTGLR